MRRFMPTASGFLNPSTTEAAMIGNWSDVVASSSGVASRVGASMPIHYDALKMQRAAIYKLSVLYFVRFAVRHRKTFDIDWDQIAGTVPDSYIQRARKEAATQMAAAVENITTPVAEPNFAVVPSSPTTSCSSTSSASDASDTTSSTGQAPDTRFNFEWCRADRLKAKLHLTTEVTATGVRAACGRRLNPSARVGTGLHTSLGLDAEWCDDCFGHLPPEAREFLRQAA